jgi:anti-anti-sigma regulatory factor
MEFHFSTNRLGENLLVTLPAGIHAAALRRQAPALYEEVARSGRGRVVFDCSSVEVMDSEDLVEMERMGQVLRMMGRRAMVCGMRPGVAFTAAVLDVELNALEFVGTLDEIDA